MFIKGFMVGILVGGIIASVAIALLEGTKSMDVVSVRRGGFRMIRPEEERLLSDIRSGKGLPPLIVRCRDCKYAKKINNCFALDGETPLYECGYVDFPHRGSAYCSWGRSVDG